MSPLYHSAEKNETYHTIRIKHKTTKTMFTFSCIFLFQIEIIVITSITVYRRYTSITVYRRYTSITVYRRYTSITVYRCYTSISVQTLY